MPPRDAPRRGHNNGPTHEAGRALRIYAWTRALEERPDKDLAPEIIRRRVLRARDLGLSYTAYAAIRLTSGRDIAAYLISSNALEVFAGGGPAPARITARLASLRDVRRIGLAVAPLTPEQLLARVPELDAAFAAPVPFGGNGDMRLALAHAQGKMPAAALVAVTALGREEEWLMAGRLGGSIPAATLFG